MFFKNLVFLNTHLKDFNVLRFLRTFFLSCNKSLQLDFFKKVNKLQAPINKGFK
jgi:hypothetical protein